MSENYTKWVACWGNATSITDRKEATYARNLTLRYPIKACFSGSALRLHLSNLTGTEPVKIDKIVVAIKSTTHNTTIKSELLTTNGTGTIKSELPTANGAGNIKSELPIANSTVTTKSELLTANGTGNIKPELSTANGSGNIKSELPTANGSGTTNSELLTTNGAGKTNIKSRSKAAFRGNIFVTIAEKQEVVTDDIKINVEAGDTIEVSLYLKEFTQMNAGTLITGPLSKGKYSYGDFAEEDELPLDLTRNTNWFYFLNTIDILTEPQNHALVCYGDSITAQSWPDYLAIRAWETGHRNISIIRRAVSGTRILRQYDCITYQAYGLKGAIRFPIEMNVAGADEMIIQHGINDIIHPVGTDINPFRPMSDMPTAKDLIDGVKEIYVEPARKHGYTKIWSGTLLPIFGWRTYNEDKEAVKEEFNEWLRTSDIFDGCVDFDKAVRNPQHTQAFADGYDSGDHLHPSEDGYRAMAACVPDELL